MEIRLERAILRHLRMPLVHFFETSFSRTYERDILIVEVVSDGISGWGEVTAGEHPFYNEEWTDSAWLLLKNYIGREFSANHWRPPLMSNPLTKHIRGHFMARGGFEVAVGTWKPDSIIGLCISRSAEERVVKSLVAYPSECRTRSNNCWKRSTRN